jgi:O-antigen/teichoic acid export membrane protein
VQFLVGWTKSFPVTIGRPHLRIVTNGAEALVIIPLTVVLGIAWGATGAAVAVLAGTCVFALLWAVIAVRVEAVDVVTS